jgi:hypothetical protein
MKAFNSKHKNIKRLSQVKKLLNALPKQSIIAERL